VDYEIIQTNWQWKLTSTGSRIGWIPYKQIKFANLMVSWYFCTVGLSTAIFILLQSIILWQSAKCVLLPVYNPGMGMHGIYEIITTNFFENRQYPPKLHWRIMSILDIEETRTTRWKYEQFQHIATSV
jgi:hypothetical protein